MRGDGEDELSIPEQFRTGLARMDMIKTVLEGGVGNKGFVIAHEARAKPCESNHSTIAY